MDDNKNVVELNTEEKETVEKKGFIQKVKEAPKAVKVAGGVVAGTLILGAAYLVLRSAGAKTTDIPVEEVVDQLLTPENVNEVKEVI